MFESSNPKESQNFLMPRRYRRTQSPPTRVRLRAGRFSRSVFHSLNDRNNFESFRRKRSSAWQRRSVSWMFVMGPNEYCEINVPVSAPLDRPRALSSIVRLPPRFYSIIREPRLHVERPDNPSTLHFTCNNRDSRINNEVTGLTAVIADE